VVPVPHPEQFRFRAAFWVDKPLKNWDFTLKLIGIIREYEDVFTPMSFFGGDTTRSQMQKWEDDDKHSKYDKLANAMLAPKAICVGLDNGLRCFKQDYPFSYTVHYADMSAKKTQPSVVSFDVGHNFFLTPEHWNTFINIAHRICEICNPLWGYIHDIDDSLAIMGRHGFAPRRRAPAAFWCNYFGPQMLRRMRIRRVLAFPYHCKKEFESGALFIQLTDNPYDITSKQEQKKLRKFAKAIKARRPRFYSKRISVQHERMVTHEKERL
jgi:hypothetical protein